MTDAYIGDAVRSPIGKRNGTLASLRADELAGQVLNGLVERNGLDLAVDAVAAIRARVPAVELRIYGEPTPFLNAVMKRVRQHGLQHVVHYLGGKGPEEIAAAIDQCDVGIIPNRRTIFTELNTPTRIFEYLALGKPVIAPRAPGIRDYFDDDALIVFELGDAEDLARKIEYVWFHARTAVEIVERGQQVYRAHAWGRERQTLVSLTADLLGSGGRAA